MIRRPQIDSLKRQMRTLDVVLERTTYGSSKYFETMSKQRILQEQIISLERDYALQELDDSAFSE